MEISFKPGFLASVVASLVVASLVVACSGAEFGMADPAQQPDAGEAGDRPDVAPAQESGGVDSSPLVDSGTDSGTATDSGFLDSGPGTDSGIDAGPADSGTDASGDAGCTHTVCGGSCVDLAVDPMNCGACGYAAVNGRTCSSGRPSPAWQPISAAGAPPARTRHAGAFLGGVFVVTGGSATQFGLGTSDVGYYSPSSNTWSPGPSLVTARCSHGSVASSLRVYVFGGLSDCSSGGTTGPGHESYNPSPAKWSTISLPGEPALRYNMAIAWIEPNKMFVYGGSNALPSVSTGGVASFGGGVGSWSDASCGLSGCARGGYLGAFVDSGLVRVWGGTGSPGGLQYNIATSAWSAWALPAGTPSPMPQRYADDGRRIFYLQGSGSCPGTVSVLAYDRLTGSWAAADTSAVPAGLSAEAAAAWTGSELVAWSGACGSGAPGSVGGRYQPPAP